MGNRRHVEWSHFRYILLLHNYSFRVLRHFSPSRSDKFFCHEEERTREAFGEKTCSYLAPKCWEKRNLRVRWSKLPSVGDDNFEQRKAVLIQNLLRIWNTAKGQNEFGNEFE